MVGILVAQGGLTSGGEEAWLRDGEVKRSLA